MQYVSRNIAKHGQTHCQSYVKPTGFTGFTNNYSAKVLRHLYFVMWNGLLHVLAHNSNNFRVGLLTHENSEN